MSAGSCVSNSRPVALALALVVAAVLAVACWTRLGPTAETARCPAAKTYLKVRQKYGVVGIAAAARCSFEH